MEQLRLELTVVSNSPALRQPQFCPEEKWLRKLIILNQHPQNGAWLSQINTSGEWSELRGPQWISRGLSEAWLSGKVLGELKAEWGRPYHGGQGG